MKIIKKVKRIFAALLAVTAALTGVLTLSACGMDEEDRQAYQEVLALALKEHGEDDWVSTGECCSWGMETPNYYDQYNFYIDEADYNDYKDYWLEDVPKEKYREGLNEDLWYTGDLVQHCINIYKLNYSENEDYMGVKLKKNTNYYLVSVYDRAVYYEYIHRYEDADNFFRSSNFNIDEYSCTAKVFYHKEKDRWIAEEIGGESKT